MGKRTFEMGDPDGYVGEYEFQVPIFVVTHEPPTVPPRQDERLTFTFVTEGIESAVEQARAAAGDKAVQVVGGVSVVRALLHAGLVDELQVDIIARVDRNRPPALRRPRPRWHPAREDRFPRGRAEDQSPLPGSQILN
jgi:dihydrofolate reductase